MSDKRRLSRRDSWIFNPLVDRLLHLSRADRQDWLSRVNRGIEAFPDIAALDRSRLMRRVVIHDVFFRVMFRFQTKMPAVASYFSRFVPVVGDNGAFAAASPDRPIVLALMHFGPIHFVFAALRRFFPNRELLVTHAGGEFGDTTAAYMRELGATPYVTDDKVLRTLDKRLGENRKSLVLISFDHLGVKGRYQLPFLGATASFARGVAYLADAHDAPIVTARWEFSRWGPRVRVAGPYFIDHTLERRSRQSELMERLLRSVEARVRIVPEAWTEWSNYRSAGPVDD